MTNLKTIKTSEIIRVENYPYSFTLKTTLIDSIDFDIKKGYRHSKQTINPKTGRENKPKKSTYSPLLVRYYDENNYIKTLHFDFNGDKEINRGCVFIANNFDFFTPVEITYLYNFIYMMALVDYKATIVYGGAKPEDLQPLYNDFLKICKDAIKTGENVFNLLQLDTEAIESTKPANFNPFTIRQY